MSPRPGEYVGLDLTLIGYIETSAVCMSRVMRRIGDNTNIYKASDETVGVEVDVEVDVEG